MSPGIVHLGLGGVHRARMARYTHNLMERDPAALDWGIVGAGLTPADKRMADALHPQDDLYTLVEGDSAGEAVIGSLAAVIFAGDPSEKLLDAIDDARVKIVSLTVTEHVYRLNRSTKRLDPDHKLVQASLAHPERPSSAIGIVVEAPRRRRAAISSVRWKSTVWRQMAAIGRKRTGKFGAGRGKSGR